MELIDYIYRCISDKQELDINEIKLLSNENAIEYVDYDNFNALMLYCEKSKIHDIEIIKLLSNKKSIEQIDRYGKKCINVIL